MRWVAERVSPIARPRSRPRRGISLKQPYTSKYMNGVQRAKCKELLFCYQADKTATGSCVESKFSLLLQNIASELGTGCRQRASAACCVLRASCCYSPQRMLLRQKGPEHQLKDTCMQMPYPMYISWRARIRDNQKKNHLRPEEQRSVRFESPQPHRLAISCGHPASTRTKNQRGNGLCGVAL